MTKQDKALIVFEMRRAGRSYAAIASRLKVSKVECYRLARVDIRHAVDMRCDDCGAGWFELKMPWCKEVFHRCSHCATRLWERSLVDQALTREGG